MNADEEYDVIFKQVVRIAYQLKVEPNTPRAVKKQFHRANVPTNFREEYYKQALIIPVVDSFISEMIHCF